MRDILSDFAIRSLSDGAGYVVDAKAPNGETKQLIGVYVSVQAAQEAARHFAEGPQIYNVRKG